MTEFRFAEDPHTATFVCTHVLEGGDPILFVVHDDEGDWQFLCGRDDHTDEDAHVVGLVHMVERDPSLNDLADMCENHHATRAVVGEPWQQHDRTEGRIRDSVARIGWHVIAVRGRSGEDPEFAYTIGLFERFKHPELLMYGLPAETLHSVLNAIGRRIADGERFEDGQRIADVLEEDLDLAVRAVRGRTTYREHFGYALWFYGGDWFPAVQIVWPDPENRFPWDAGFDSTLTAMQPLPE